MRGASPARKDEARLKRASSWGGAGPERELVVVLLGLRVRDAHVQDDLAVLVRVLLLGDVDPDLVVAGAAVGGIGLVVVGQHEQTVVAVAAVAAVDDVCTGSAVEGVVAVAAAETVVAVTAEDRVVPRPAAGTVIASAEVDR